MKTYEYKVIDFTDVDYGKRDRVLDRHGAVGWLLVCFSESCAYLVRERAAVA